MIILITLGLNVYSMPHVISYVSIFLLKTKYVLGVATIKEILIHASLIYPYCDVVSVYSQL